MRRRETDKIKEIGKILEEYWHDRVAFIGAYTFKRDENGAIEGSKTVTARQICSLFERDFEERASEYCRDMGWGEPS